MTIRGLIFRCFVAMLPATFFAVPFFATEGDFEGWVAFAVFFVAFFALIQIKIPME